MYGGIIFVLLGLYNCTSIGGAACGYKSVMIFLDQAGQRLDQSRSDMMYTYTGSACDSGQMAHVQSMCRPAPGPTANWLETQSKQQQQQQLKEDGEPVAVRVMTNGSGAPSERSDNYVRPFGNNQPEPASPPSHLAFLYERAQQPVKSPLTEMAVCPPNGFVGVTSPRSDEYRSLSRAVPAPIHQYQRQQQQQQQPSTAAGTSTDGSPEYNPFSRATPAPIQQHSPAVGAERPAMISSADAGTPTSPRTTQHVNSEPRTAEVTYYILSLSTHLARCGETCHTQSIHGEKIFT